MTWYLRLFLGLTDTKSPFLRLSLIAFLYYSLLAVGAVGNVFSGASGRVPLYGVLWSCLAPLVYVYTPSTLLSLYALLVSSSAPLYTALESVCVVLLAEAVSRYLHRFICSSDLNTSSSAKAAVLILSAAGVLLSSMMWRVFLDDEPVASESSAIQQWVLRLLPFVCAICIVSVTLLSLFVEDGMLSEASVCSTLLSYALWSGRRSRAFGMINISPSSILSPFESTNWSALVLPFDVIVFLAVAVVVLIVTSKALADASHTSAGDSVGVSVVAPASDAPSSHMIVSGPAVQACLVVLGTHVAGVSLGHYQNAWLYWRTLQMPFTVFVYAFLLYRKAGNYEFS